MSDERPIDLASWRMIVERKEMISMIREAREEKAYRERLRRDAEARRNS